jgi:hypothetical protein
MMYPVLPPGEVITPKRFTLKLFLLTAYGLNVGNGGRSVHRDVRAYNAVSRIADAK